MSQIKKSGTVRRVDLYLRGEFPELNTTIYRLKNNKYEIYCENYFGSFETLKEIFDYRIKMFFCPVEIVQVIPVNYEEIIPKIEDDEISKNFEGMPLSKIALLNLLQCKFPEINFYKIGNDAGIVNIYIANYHINDGKTKKYIFLNKFGRQKLEDFLIKLNLDIEFNIIIKEFEEKPIIEEENNISPVKFIYASKLNGKNKLDYSKRDEALWFDKVDDIFKGGFNKNDLYFYNEKDYSCYVDFSSFPNIDLRNHLFLYEVIYITPPFEKDITTWLKESKIEKKEFLYLVEKKRIKLVLTQPESRYDINFINDVYNVAPKSVITRRALACLQQIDLVEKSNNYIFNDFQSIDNLRKFTIAIADKLDKDPKQLFDTITWPIKAIRNSFDVLNNSGLLSASAFGVNNVLQKSVSEAFNKDLEFDYTVNSPSIHIAHSLNATYFPFRGENYSDEFYASTMGTMLNFYKSATPDNLKSFIENQERIQTGIPIINPIDLIDVNSYISITELENTLSKEVIFPNSKKLIETLAELDETERAEKIKLYNEKVSKKINSKNLSSRFIDLSIDAAGAITGFSFLGTMYSILESGAKLVKQDRSVKDIIRKIEEAVGRTPDSQNISYLVKINPVAKLKKHK